MEDEKKSIDRDFQESKFIDDEFRHEDVEYSSQGFMTWDSPTTYDEEPEEDDSWEKEKPLEEHEEDGFYPMFDGLYPKEDDQLDGEEYKEDGFFPCLMASTPKMINWKRRSP